MTALAVANTPKAGRYAPVATLYALESAVNWHVNAVAIRSGRVVVEKNGREVPTRQAITSRYHVHNRVTVPYKSCVPAHGRQATRQAYAFWRYAGQGESAVGEKRLLRERLLKKWLEPSRSRSSTTHAKVAVTLAEQYEIQHRLRSEINVNSQKCY